MILFECMYRDFIVNISLVFSVIYMMRIGRDRKLIEYPLIKKRSRRCRHFKQSLEYNQSKHSAKYIFVYTLLRKLDLNISRFQANLYWILLYFTQKVILKSIIIKDYYLSYKFVIDEIDWLNHKIKCNFFFCYPSFLTPN